MNGTSTALVGLAGVVVGALLRMLYDLRKTRHDEERADIVWRREHALAAAAEFMQNAAHLQVVGRTISDHVENLVASRQAGHVDAVRQATDTLNTWQQRKQDTLIVASNALTRLSLLLSQDAYMAANLYLEAVTIRPHDPDTTGVSAHVNNLIRADVGLPPRVIPEGEGITVEQYRERVDELRKQRSAAEKVADDLG